MSFLKSVLKGAATYIEEQSKSASKSHNFTDDQKADMLAFSAKAKSFRESLSESNYDEDEEYCDTSWFWIDVDKIVNNDGSFKTKVKKEFISRYVYQMSCFRERFKSIDINTIIESEYQNAKYNALYAVEDSWKYIVKSGKGNYIERYEYMNAFDKYIDEIGEYFWDEIGQEIRVNEDYDGYNDKGSSVMWYLDKFSDYLNKVAESFCDVIDEVLTAHHIV